MTTITALIISNKRYDYLIENVRSLKKFNADIFVVVNGFDENIVNFLEQTKSTYDKLNFSIISNQVQKSQARNAGIDKIKSGVIYFLDDDAYIGEDNILVLREKFEQYPSIGVIGGPNLTPPGAARFENISGIMLSTYLFSWKMSRRYLKTGKDRLADDSELILCNLAVKKDLFVKYNLRFEKLLHYNEENLLLEQLKKRNVKMLYTPNLYVYHHRRKSLFTFMNQVYSSGKGRALMLFFTPSSIKIPYLLPALFVIYLIALIIEKTTVVLLYIYLLSALYNVITTFILYNLKLRDITLMFVITVSSHFCYGLGFICGLTQGILWKIKKIF